MSSQAVKLQGGKELRHLCDELPKRVRTKALRQGVSAAATPVVKQLKANTRRQSGLLKRAETKKIKTYKGGNTVIAVIGANRNVTGEYQGRARVPANYFHLINDGVAPHGKHPGFAGDHMLQHAYDSTKDQASTIMLDKMQTVLEAEAAKLANGG